MRILLYLQALVISTTSMAQTEQSANAPIPLQQSVIAYSSVADAMTALKAKPGVSIDITKPDAWTIINEPGNVQWSFTPSTHAAYPAVVRRELKVNTVGNLFIEMTALCQATKIACDKLLEEFKELNERTRQAVRKGVQSGNQAK